MKIVIVNKYHYMDGGPERYMFGLSEYLRSIGHEVIPFAVAYARNLPSEYSEYFLKPAGGGSGSKLDQLEGGPMAKLRIAARSVYSFEAKAALGRLIDAVKPDIVYTLNIVNHMSPSIVDAAHSRGIPVVMRLSDYNLTCASYLYLRDGKICTNCEKGAYHAIPGRCVYGSLTATLCRVGGMYLHRLMRIYDKVDAFVTPALFMKGKLVAAGFPEDKIHHIPTFVNAANWLPRYDNDGYILYFGRLWPEKGVEFLLRSYVDSHVSDPLVIVGDGREDYIADVRKRIGESNLGNVQFVGHKSGKDLQDYVRGAKYIVVPSMCFDNTPNVVYESFAAGKPVIASALGGLCEQVTNETGILVEAGNTEQLAAAIRRLSSDPESVDKLGRGARRHVEEKHAVETHAARLLDLFSALIDSHSK